ncbi:aldo/keto reductase family protein [Klebsormidium nitens]|uniref:Aldo/keto reductase family protein n=1 Tax=Klebsormidium nitens TaxID=105231 RepID=A0A1Y1IAU3_KLENI|nr:aldo/keto reductase family protein [Klebsormidium nitens]|eukprot:GAQ86549.1 aldo/keto reductase family protein [Klebsormidium nitens]
MANANEPPGGYAEIANPPQNTVVKIPRLGFGTYQIPPGYETEQAVSAALKVGYRHIDTAAVYQNEESVGAAIKKSGLPREELFVTTKLWNSDHGFERTLHAFGRSLHKLELDYVDLYLVHAPGSPRTRDETWRAMESILEAGKARAVGVSNFGVKHLEHLLKICNYRPAVNQVRTRVARLTSDLSPPFLECYRALRIVFDYRPADNQIELHPYNQRKDIVGYCRENGIALEAYAPLTRGRKLNDPPLVEIAKKYHKATAQILIRWGLQKGFIVIAKSTNRERMKMNLEASLSQLPVTDFEIGPDDMAKLDALDEKLVTDIWDPTAEP